jgi:hypothetical protein
VRRPVSAILALSRHSFVTGKLFGKVCDIKSVDECTASQGLEAHTLCADDEEKSHGLNV